MESTFAAEVEDLYESIDDMLYHIDTINFTWNPGKINARGFLQNRNIYGGKDYQGSDSEVRDEDAMDIDPEVKNEQEARDKDDGEAKDGAKDGTKDEDTEEIYEAEAAGRISEMFGSVLDERINKIRSIGPITIPVGITCTPHMHQLYAASRLAFLLRSPLLGAILADKMGLGKTISAILTMRLAGKVDGEGPCLIVTKKSIISHWAQEIDQLYDDGNKLKVLVLTPTTTARQLYQYDVVLTNFEAIRQQYTSMRTFAESFRDDAPPVERLPLRPPASVLSDIHKKTGLKFRLIIDEAQFAKGHDSVTNRALRAIPRSYTLLLSGTVLDNDWGDIYGLLQFFSGHPFTSREFFMETFGSKKKGRRVAPTSAKTRRLIKFLLSTLLSRPEEILELKEIQFEDVPFTLDNSEKRSSDDFVRKYMAATKGREDQHDASALTLLVKAMQEGTHPSLRGISGNSSASHLTGVAEEESEEATTARGESHIAWLQRIREDGTAMDSSRMKALKSQFDAIIAEDALKPVEDRRRMIITSASTKVLDIVSIVIQGSGVTTLFFDGRVSTSDRTSRLREFQCSEPGTVVLLVTPGAGGTGLNIPQASVLIQTEVWWNHNTELQVYCRMRRPGQSKDIQVYRLFATNAKVDRMILVKQTEKSSRNDRIMKAVTWPDEGGILVPAV